jgi:hypothetical protein
MTSRNFLKLLTRSVLVPAFVVLPIAGAFTTARGATLAPTVSDPSVVPAFTAAALVVPFGHSTSAESAPRCKRTLRRIKTAELNAETIQRSATIVREHYTDPIGTEVSFDAGQRHFVGRIERHYHEFDSKGRPWGFHKGCSLFEVTCE